MLNPLETVGLLKKRDRRVSETGLDSASWQMLVDKRRLEAEKMNIPSRFYFDDQGPHDTDFEIEISKKADSTVITFQRIFNNRLQGVSAVALAEGQDPRFVYKNVKGEWVMFVGNEPTINSTLGSRFGALKDAKLRDPAKNRIWISNAPELDKALQTAKPDPVKV